MDLLGALLERTESGQPPPKATPLEYVDEGAENLGAWLAVLRFWRFYAEIDNLKDSIINNFEDLHVLLVTARGRIRGPSGIGLAAAQALLERDPEGPYVLQAIGLQYVHLGALNKSPRSRQSPPAV